MVVGRPGLTTRPIRVHDTKTEESIHELYGIDLKVARVDGRKFVLTV